MNLHVVEAGKFWTLEDICVLNTLVVPIHVYCFVMSFFSRKWPHSRIWKFLLSPLSKDHTFTWMEKCLIRIKKTTSTQKGRWSRRQVNMSKKEMRDVPVWKVQVVNWCLRNEWKCWLNDWSRIKNILINEYDQIKLFNFQSIFSFFKWHFDYSLYSPNTLTPSKIRRIKNTHCITQDARISTHFQSRLTSSRVHCLVYGIFITQSIFVCPLGSNLFTIQSNLLGICSRIFQITFKWIILNFLDE